MMKLREAFKRNTVNVGTAYHKSHVDDLEAAIEHLVTLRAAYIKHAIETPTANTNDPQYKALRQEHIQTMYDAIQQTALSMKDTVDYVVRNRK